MSDKPKRKPGRPLLEDEALGESRMIRWPASLVRKIDLARGAQSFAAFVRGVLRDLFREPTEKDDQRTDDEGRQDPFEPPSV